MKIENIGRAGPHSERSCVECQALMWTQGTGAHAFRVTVGDGSSLPPASFVLCSRHLEKTRREDRRHPNSVLTGLPMTEDTALVKPNGRDNDPVRGLQRYLEPRSKALAKFAASRIKPDVLIRLALFQFSQDEWLRRCTPESIYGALILSAQVGLEPSGIRGEAYLVPYKGKCTLIPGWRGLVKLALRSKAVKSLYSHVVYENDKFTVFLGSEPRVEHVPALEDRGEIIAAYAVARMENGEIDVEVMGIEDLQKIKETAAKSRGGKAGPAYDSWEDQMFRKAPIRRLAKRLPLGDDFFLAMKADELAESGEPEKIAQYIDVDASEPPALTDAIGDKLVEKANRLREQNDA